MGGSHEARNKFAKKFGLIAYIRSHLQRFPDVQVQVIVVPAFDEEDDVHGFEDVEHHVILVHDRHAGNVAFHEHVDDVHDGRVHRCGREVRVRAHRAQLFEGFPQHLRLFDIDGHEFQDAVLSYETHDHFALGFVVFVYERDAAGAGAEH